MPYAAVLSTHFETMAVILQDFSVLMGVCLLVGAMFQLKRYGEMRTMMSQQMTLAGPLMMLVASALLLTLPAFLGTGLLALWGNQSPLHYEGGPAGYSQLIPPILIFVRLIGVGSIIRGVILLSRVGHTGGQPGMMGKAFIHIVAGLMCLHILGLVHLLGNIFDVTV